MMLSPNKESSINIPVKKTVHLAYSDNSSELLPRDGRLRSLLGLDDYSYVEDVLRDALINPVAELTSNPGKRVRGKLVELTYRLLGNEAESSFIAARRLKIGAEVLELIHAGSLIVDDIEDGSQIRRGRPALHVRYGLPISLNAGNWLYFWPSELIKDLKLPGETTLAAYENYHRALLRAHFGQAVDIGTRVDMLAQNRVAEVCQASLALKTGALTGFAMVLGGLIAGVGEPTISHLETFGRELGVALQMFDDIGNVTGACEPSKRYEDFMLYRPSWAWAWVAMNSTAEDYARFIGAVSKLPDALELEKWVAKHGLITKARSSASQHLDLAFSKFKNGLDSQRVPWSQDAFEVLVALGEEIANAYS
jgi:geranylgeranyl pyrophosphate synthase